MSIPWIIISLLVLTNVRSAYPISLMTCSSSMSRFLEDALGERRLDPNHKKLIGNAACVLNSHSGFTPLHEVASRGGVNAVAVVAVLGENYANVLEKDTAGVIPLHIAARRGSSSVVAALSELASRTGRLGAMLRQKAKPMKGNGDEETALDIAEGVGHVVVAQLLFSLGAKRASVPELLDRLESWLHGRCPTAAVDAVYQNDATRLAELLDEGVETQTKKVNSIVEDVGHDRVDIFTGSHSSEFVPTLAAGDVCYRWCEDGSENYMDRRNECPVSAPCTSTVPSGLAAFDSCGPRAHVCGGHFASTKGKSVENIFPNPADCIAHPVDLGQSLIHLATTLSTVRDSSGTGTRGVVHILLERRVSVSRPDASGERPLAIAARAEDAHLVELLVESDPEHVNAQDALGRTALHEAAIAGAARVVRILLKKDADPTQMDDTGMLPNDYAYQEGHHSIGELLDNAGKIWNGGFSVGTFSGFDNKHEEKNTMGFWFWGPTIGGSLASIAAAIAALAFWHKAFYKQKAAIVAWPSPGVISKKIDAADTSPDVSASKLRAAAKSGHIGTFPAKFCAEPVGAAPPGQCWESNSSEEEKHKHLMCVNTTSKHRKPRRCKLTLEDHSTDQIQVISQQQVTPKAARPGLANVRVDEGLGSPSAEKKEEREVTGHLGKEMVEQLRAELRHKAKSANQSNIGKNISQSRPARSKLEHSSESSSDGPAGGKETTQKTGNRKRGRR